MSHQPQNRQMSGRGQKQSVNCEVIVKPIATDDSFADKHGFTEAGGGGNKNESVTKFKALIELID